MLQYLFWGCALCILCDASVIHMQQSQALFNIDPTKTGPKKSQSTCGYQSCDLGKEDMLNVHLVPHTHDDVGWLKTVDQYYYGSKNNIQHAGVQYILDTVVDELLKDKNRRFIYVEIAFFSRWWDNTHDSVREVVKGLVNQGRLQFILGGWSMNDEASTHYNAIIDQHTVGLKFLQTNFHDCGRPLVAWQIDPFGHSREQASLFAQMGYDAVYFARLDYQDRHQREKTKNMEMIWKGSPQNLGSVADLFSGALARGNYGPPSGFCWDAHCSDTPIMDDDRLEDYNVDKMVKLFLSYAKNQSDQFKTNHIMWTMGSDFQYQNAHEWYKNLDKIIKYVNQNQTKHKVNALYSTPSCYTYAKNKAAKKANITWATKTDDFFPYAHIDHGFWTGYFTSRAALKGMVRQTNNFLQVVKQLDVLSQLEVEHSTQFKIDILREAMGVAQHHDAVSGTEKQQVAYDYAKRLAKGVLRCQEVVYHAYSKLMPKPTTKVTLPPQSFCHQLNISQCHVTESSKLIQVIAYNPIVRPVKHWIRLPIPTKTYQVFGPDGNPVVAQMMDITSRTETIPERESTAKYEIVFQASLPPLGYSTYFVEYHGSVPKTTKKSTSFQLKTDTIIKNEHISLTFDGTSGMLKSMTNLDKKLTIKLDQSLRYYQSYAGNCSEGKFQASGAYIFRPNGTATEPVSIYVATNYVMGKLVQEVHQTYGGSDSWATTVYRLYNGASTLEIEWTVGPIPITDHQGKEVISLFDTDLDSSDLFYTDANGREILQRRRDYRNTWKLKQTEPIAGNYYPVNSRIYIQDVKKNMQLTVLTDRSQGGSSLKSGQIELMVHRRTLYDDHLGVGEPLNETGQDGRGLIVRGKHYLLLDNIADSAVAHRDLAERLFMAPVLSFSNSSLGYIKWFEQFTVQWSGVQKALPSNVHLLTLEAWRGSSILLRLENFYEKEENPKPAVVQLKNVFKPFAIASAVELTLGANQKLADSKRLNWGNNQESLVSSGPINDDLTITLKPMQIKTFQVTLSASV